MRGLLLRGDGATAGGGNKEKAIDDFTKADTVADSYERRGADKAKSAL